MLWLNLAIISVAAYLLGSFNGSIFVSKCMLHNDIRRFGSGNGGLTNFMRTFGGPMTLLVVAIDVLKAVAAALIGGWLLGRFGHAVAGQVLGIFFVDFGHMFPVFFSFKGGKGILSTAGGMAVVSWIALVLLLAIFGLFVLITRRVSVGSIAAAIAYPVTIWFLCGCDPAATAIAAAGGVLILVMHRANIIRLFKGEEPKFSLKKHGGHQ